MALFVSGSGTGVGKTLVTTILLSEIRKAGKKCTAVKPIISGFDENDPAESDSALILGALGQTVSQNSLDSISPWRFREPISPDMAAEHEGRSLDIDEIAEFCKAKVVDDTLLLIEGVGGVMVPLSNDHTVLDLMTKISAPVLLVVGSYLGTLSHTLTALHMVQNRGLTVIGIVVSESLENPVPLSETVTTLSRFSANIPIVTLPRQADISDLENAPSIATHIGLL
ncbi:MAG: dethiobiotin synthase [Rhodospirillaceae bacterium]|nr:dethiobiotin synthase [Rhodospirillaceae bacterium]|tara:strand:- start:15723 stop:16400 length:678 start_codon:yes stop_codon:yes gene_type:complete